MNDYTVILIAILAIWLGIFAYIMMLDRKVSRLEKELKR